MSKKKQDLLFPDETVISKIYLLRGKKVMLDRDLAELYGVETRIFKQAVKRNIERFPKDFMFEMNKGELRNWRSQFVISNSDKHGLRYAPFCFTEQGVAMLSGILNSPTAIRVNIQIIRVFTKMREMLLTHKDILLELEKMQQKLTNHDSDIVLIFEHLKQLLNPPPIPRKRIGFRRNDEKD